MAKSNCKFNNCDRDSWAKGYCTKHYYYAQRHGLLPRRKCVISDCDQPAFRKELCNKHHLRMVRHHDTEFRHKVGNGERISQPCSIEGCAKPCRGPNYCATHYARFKRWGNPLICKKLANGTSTPEHRKEVAARAMRTYNQTPHGRMRIKFANAKRRAFRSDHGVKKEQLLAIWNSPFCGICGKPVADKEKSLDHVIPIARGGNNLLSNLQLAHLKCNQLKGVGGYQ